MHLDGAHANSKKQVEAECIALDLLLPFTFLGSWVLNKKILNFIAKAKYKLSVARIFHTDSSRGAANPDGDTTGGRETALETAPNLTVTAVYPRLSRALVLPEEQFEAYAVSIRCSQAAAESV